MDDNENRRSPNWRLFLVLAAAAIGYVMLRKVDLYDSAMLYLGIPVFLALGLSLTPRTRTAMGATMKGMTIALLMSAVLFREGYICILFAAPLFYGIGAIIAHSVDKARRRNERPLQATAIATLFAVLSLEGTTEYTTFARDNTVSASEVVRADVTQIRQQLAKTPQLDPHRPWFLKIFPYPAVVSGSGLAVGDVRHAQLVAYKHIWWTKVTGDVVFRVTESTPNKVRFVTVKDDSYISHYLKWNASEVQLEPLDATHTKVTWTHEYTRLLDPAWYFGPLQHYAVKLMTEHLIDNVAMPHAPAG